MFAVLQYVAFMAAVWLWTSMLVVAPQRGRLVRLVARVGVGR